ncbi:hypothetical protein [Bifidobacterium longum]|uniref:hypothetical protein n=1 Tax=Bifidobacterium longum TaxID=216816 RepID=UPI000E4AB647|nr:hypothetical protein [Bifidobacterium longum]RGV45772.1 hypothetical protein DWW11_02040 [Bifidobacterium longum]RGV63919.1 hypothetical protein DWW06_02060 [Bifidobacterium longum]
MDMNWIDEIRDPEPRKRYIYNADDYDPQYGDPYYREHSTRADSLWRLYEESGTSITFDAFADESRQTDYRMETGALRDFFNGSQSALSSYRNPMGGNPPIEWDIDARVRDFAERMGDEYTSLYEQDTTSIKGGDFERFGAFADNHLDFIRALTKARGMDPISSDREIGAFLNTFDKLAAMPEPTPAKQEKDELSAGACDPADPLNLEQSSSYGMTR